MPYEGHCLCNSIRICLKEQPSSSLRCYCENCARSGGGSSINYALDDTDVDILDKESSMRRYADLNTESGNEVTRSFCGKCGSPIMTITPKFPNKTLIKASLFDEISAPSMEVFTTRRPAWMGRVEGAEQA